MKHCSILPALLLAMLALLVAGSSAEAQFETTPFLSLDQQAIAQARSLARDSLGDDATLIYIGTFGDIEMNGLRSQFDLNNGRANAWGYVFYSPSTDRTKTFAVVKILILYQAIDVGDLPLLILPGMESLDISATYANSSKLVERLKTNATFNAYRSKLPGAKPDLVSYTPEFVTGGPPLPIGFPTDEPLWSINFVGAPGSDTNMTCFVAARSGNVLCRSLAPSAVPTSEASAGTTSIGIAPNPANGRTRISITAAEGMSAAACTELALYNVKGEKVLDLTESFRSNGFQSVEFDSSTLPAGLYYCRGIGSNWTGTTGVIIE